MEDVPDPRGLDINVRRIALDMIKSKLSECSSRYYSIPEVRDKINRIAIKCEQGIFEDAKSKEEYHLRIQEKVVNAISKMQSRLFTSSSGNSQQRTMTPGLVNSAPPQQRSVWSCLQQNQNMVIPNQQQPSCNQFPTPSPTMQPGIGAIQTTLNQLYQNQAFGQQNVMQTNTRYQTYLRNKATRERILNFDRHRETLAAISRLENAQMPQQPSYPRVTAQQHQINQQQFQDTRLQGHQMLSPSPYVAYPNLAANNNQFAQSLNTNATRTSVMPTFHAADPEWEYLFKELALARSSYLLEFKTWLQRLDEQRPLVQTVKHKDFIDIHTSRLQEMIKILTSPNNSLMGFCSKERMCEYLKQFVEYHNYMTQKIAAAYTRNQAQAQQFFSPYNQAVGGGSQSMQSVSAPMNTSFSYPQSVDATSLGRGSVFGLERGTADHNIHHNMNQNQQLYQTTSRNNFMNLSSEQQINPTFGLADKGKQPMDSMWQPGSFDPIIEPQGNRNQVMDSALAPLSPSTRVTPMGSQKQSGKCIGKSSGSAHQAWLNLAGPRRKGRPRFTYWPTNSSENSGQIGASASHVNIGDVQQPDGTRRLSTDSPSNRVMETEDLVRLAAPQPPLGNNPDSQIFWEPIQTRVDQNPDSHIYALTDTEETQNSEQRPIDRLVTVVENTSPENLSSAAKDMQEELIQMDCLPFNAAGLDDFELFVGDDDFTNFLNDIDFTENCELQPNKKLKHDVDSESKDVDMPSDDPNNIQSSLPPNNLSPNEPNHKLNDEIIEAHRVLLDTVIATPSNLTEKHSDGTIVRCVYTPIAVSEEIKRLLPTEEQSISLSIEFLVPFNYPDVPPKILGSWLPEGCVGRTVQMTESTKAMFEEQVRGIDPLRVGEMAKLWDQCAKTVFLDYARQFGAQTETFSSSSGEWDLCLSDC